MAFAMAADAVSAWPPDWPPGDRSAYGPDRVPSHEHGSDSRTESPTWPESKVCGGAVRMLCEHTGSRSRRPARAIAAPPSATHSAATGTSTTASVA